MRDHGRRSAAVATAVGGLVTVVCLLPVFLTGALSVLLMADLGFGTAALGIAIAMPRGAGAIFSPLLGRLADNLGATRSIRLAASGATLACVGIAVTSYGWLTLIPWLILSGLSGALGQPAANRLLAQRIPRNRLGWAFGLKQSAPPVASMLAGLSVPLLALTFGWRWAFALAGVLALIAVAVAGPAPQSERRHREVNRVMTRGVRLERRRVLLLLGVAFGLGTAASSTLTTFFVDSTVRAGAESSFAGSILAVASVAAITTRISAGAMSDRLISGHLTLCAGLLVFGAIGFGLLASDVPTVMAVGAVVGAAGAWGFNGVFWHALLRRYPRFPGQITGTIAPGALLGATLGPAILGVVAESFGFPVAWSIAAALALGAGGAMAVAERLGPKT